MKERFFTVLLALFFVLVAHAGQQAFAYQNELEIQQAAFSNPIFNYCPDGDTCNFTFPNMPKVFSQNYDIRFRGVDTPEIYGKCEWEVQAAKKAKAFVVDQIRQARRIEILEIGKGYYYNKSGGKRLLGSVYLDGKSLSQMILDQNLGRVYLSGKRRPWC